MHILNPSPLPTTIIRRYIKVNSKVTAAIDHGLHLYVVIIYLALSHILNNNAML